MATKEELAVAFAFDVAEHGLRCDLKPTMPSNTAGTQVVHLAYQEYLARIDAALRERAKLVLAGHAAEGGT